MRIGLVHLVWAGPVNPADHLRAGCRLPGAAPAGLELVDIDLRLGAYRLEAGSPAVTVYLDVDAGVTGLGGPGDEEKA
ncbi:hypothetical protein ACFRK5_34270 [Streptomyces niveus]|uniref:hypothetical protein n=1 Tax=Streptomyces niveus TaxID=193462 RepID=UPI0036BDEC66